MQLTFTAPQSPDVSEQGRTQTIEVTDHDSLTIRRKYEARAQAGGD